MGILNVTPDSFSDGGMFFDPSKAIKRGIEIEREGADILDIGGESTRPGAKEAPVSEQIRRVVPVIHALKGKIKIPISIDTSDAKVAKEAVEAGASIINDITGLHKDKGIADVASEYKTGLCIMHIKGAPGNMQDAPYYKDLMKEICGWLKDGIKIARAAGVSQSRIMIDPGIGFGKTLQHNLKILKNLHELEKINRPLLIGPSRKSFIGKILNLPPEERIMGTASAVAISIMNGAHIVRVHDVKEMKQVARLADAVLGV